MAALPAPVGPGDDASAVLDELSRNFTYWAPGPGNGSLSSAWYRRNQIHLFGVLLAILGNLVISISLNIQKYSHLHLAQKEQPEPCFKSVLWWSGALLMAIGETGNFAAYGVAPITLIAPLGCVSVTGSAIISVIFLKENLRASDLLASLTVISVRAVSGMITLSVTGKMQLTDTIFYIMLVIMIASCIFQVKFLNQATKLYTMTTVVPVNHVFITTSAILAGIIFYQEFLGAAFLTVFIYLFGCFLSFLGVFLVTRNREKEHLQQPFIGFGNIPGKQMLDKIQPDSNGLSYGTLPGGSDSTKSQSGEKKEA
ncbi:NIPA-like protein 2 isoform X2 [Meriones unguiculatus]|uniref:NIPA-like protein 2 isoform X2 n=1 Tax=Meriones unguiculatus TaxID=10047 RepID=UPI00293E5417|nr:NIPA-like protein 2 isoform X2 [Meriones unguiculatus]